MFIGLKKCCKKSSLSIESSSKGLLKSLSIKQLSISRSVDIIVKKFGGTSVGTVERIKCVADLVALEAKQGQKLIVVLSAMSGVTDQLVGYTSQISACTTMEAQAEYDAVVAAGEQISVGLLALALQERGLKARSYQGWQIPIETDGNHAGGSITKVNTTLLWSALARDEIPIVVGFQGVHSNRVVTLGRGGSDTTAAAVAAAMKAVRCDIYTDVCGVFTADPRIVEKASKLDEITYEEMLEMALTGAKVLHPRAIEIAMQHKVQMRVLSSFKNTSGTRLVNEEDIMERQLITGITGSSDVASVTILQVMDASASIQRICSIFEANGVKVEMLLQNIAAEEASTEVTLVIDKPDAIKVKRLLEDSQCIGVESYKIDTNIIKISVIGIGLKNHPSIRRKVFKTLAERGIKILAVATSEVKISVLIDAIYKELAMRILHSSFELDKEG